MKQIPNKDNAKKVKDDLRLYIATVRAEIKHNYELSQYHLDNAKKSIRCIVEDKF